MKELEFIETINKTLSKNSHLGDDCACLKDLGIVITQDSLVEDIHFSLQFSTPYQLAYKAINVNLSDIFASGAKPQYLTISLSLPKETDNEFIKEFYKACDELSQKFDFEIIGGDITGADKIFISICAIGITKGRKISSRSNAKVGDYVITSGNHGSSAAGLWLLTNNRNKEAKYDDIIDTHICPKAQELLSKEISTKANSDYAMMDSSDGLADALYKIAQASKVSVNIDFSKIPYDKNIEEIANLATKNIKDWIFYGGEDFQLIACVNEETLLKIDKQLYTIIGRIEERHQDSGNLTVNYPDGSSESINLTKTYNHFKENGGN